MIIIIIGLIIIIIIIIIIIMIMIIKHKLLIIVSRLMDEFKKYRTFMTWQEHISSGCNSNVGEMFSYPHLTVLQT